MPRVAVYGMAMVCRLGGRREAPVAELRTAWPVVPHSIISLHHVCPSDSASLGRRFINPCCWVISACCRYGEFEFIPEGGDDSELNTAHSRRFPAANSVKL